MHPNLCIFPSFWATMHISSSQWNIKHSYDLIFSSKRDFSLYIIFTSLASPPGLNFRGCLYLPCLFTWEDVWLANAEVMINETANQFQRLSRLRGHWSMRGVGSERQVGSIPTHLIEIREVQTVQPLSLPQPSNFICQLLFRWKRLMCEMWKGKIYRVVLSFLLPTSLC